MSLDIFSSHHFWQKFWSTPPTWLFLLRLMAAVSPLRVLSCCPPGWVYRRTTRLFLPLVSVWQLVTIETKHWRQRELGKQNSFVAGEVCNLTWTHLGVEQEWSPASAVGLWKRWLGLHVQTTPMGQLRESVLGPPDVVILLVNRRDRWDLRQMEWSFNKSSLTAKTTWISHVFHHLLSHVIT